MDFGSCFKSAGSRIIVSLAVAAFIGLTARGIAIGQETDAPAGQPVEIQRLKQLVGGWDARIALKLPDGTTLSGKGDITVKEIASGNGISSSIKLETEGMGRYEEEDLWSYDRWGKKAHLFSVTSTGEVHDHSGGWKDDKTLTLHWKGLYEGKSATEEMTIHMISSQEIQVHDVYTQDGKPGPVTDFSLKRK